MALKTVYKDTRGDKKSLLRDVRPGDLLYVIHDVADRYVLGKGEHGYDDPHFYTEHIVVHDKAPFTRHPMVRSTSNGSLESVSQLHTREREIHTQPPSGVRHIAA